MRRYFLFLGVFAFFIPSPASSHLSANANSYVEGKDGTVSLNRKKILQLVNDARGKGCKCGGTYYKPVPALSWDEQLEKAARAHSNDMNSKKYFSHTSRDGSGAGERIRRAGYNWLAYAENIGMGFRDEKEMVEGWLRSPGHCKNIMDGSFKEMGVGRAGNYWTQTFGAR